jgi:hypothetical protein
VSGGGWERRRGRVEASGAAQCQRVGEQSAATQGWWAAASPARLALGFHGGGSQWDPHVRHCQRDGNGVGGLHRCDFRIGRVKLSTLPNYG